MPGSTLSCLSRGRAPKERYVQKTLQDSCLCRTDERSTELPSRPASYRGATIGHNE